MEFPISRRTFVEAASGALVLCGVGSAATMLTSQEGLLRPPGAQDETALIAKCLRCGRCVSVCHANLIVDATLEDCILALRTPKLDFHRGYCDFCDDCRKVCAVSAIGIFDPAKDKIGMAIVQRDRCIAFVQGCQVCVDACEYEAIALDASGCPVVDPDLCNGCGACEYSCPALVYRSFAGGTRRGIRVVSLAEYEAIGSTIQDGGLQ